MNIITCIAPVNIAVIKYWGKRDEKLILPLNDSVSATLNLEQMHAKTTVMISPDFKEDKIWLNGKEESFHNQRLQNCLQEIRRKAKLEEDGDDDGISNWYIRICSENNFPTAAGLASSAAGYACLVYALARLYNVSGDISGIARQGSGSACRSLLGGFVRWNKGCASDGSDSIATQIVPESHWPDLRILILVVSDKRKKVSSSSGMKNSVETSDLLKYRVSHCVPQRTEAIIKAIQKKDFETFAEITMKDSNQFHAVCLDTFPPNVYMNDTSHAIVNFIHAYNKACGKTQVAYTFDAGPNACFYLLESEIPRLLTAVNHIFPSEDRSVEYIRGIPSETTVITQEFYDRMGMQPQEPGLLKYIIHTRVGSGPQVLKEPHHHLLTEAGLPKATVKN
ncbi:diphosphomevalonate decarboxylase [Periplaneta americana]|uniref:diphosphomevalonate decarboxylase n=1 Tax=Periplaneta americana TaxID=6978 RepID=UPI0037E99753